MSTQEQLMKIMMFGGHTVQASVVMMFCMVLCTIPVLSQNFGEALPTPRQQEAQLTTMNSAVGLTPGRLTQIRAINADFIKNELDARNSGDDPASTARKLKLLQGSQRASIRILLTDTQRSKYDAYLMSTHKVPAHSAPSNN
jgi:hypothetical protein